MIKNKSRLIFPVTNTFFWFVVGIELCCRDIENIGGVLVAAILVFALDYNLIKSMRDVPHGKTMLANIIPSIFMSLAVFPSMFLGVEFAGGVFMFLLLLGFLVALLMVRAYLPRVVHGYAAVRPGQPGNARFRSAGQSGSQDEGSLGLPGQGRPTALDDSTRSFGVNPANGMPMLETGFDMSGNVYGTNSADDLSRSFSHTDTPGFGFSDYHSIDISPSHDWHSHDISSDIHNNHGINDY